MCVCVCTCVCVCALRWHKEADCRALIVGGRNVRMCEAITATPAPPRPDLRTGRQRRASAHTACLSSGQPSAVRDATRGGSRRGGADGFQLFLFLSARLALPLRAPSPTFSPEGPGARLVRRLVCPACRTPRRRWGSGRTRAASNATVGNGWEELHVVGTLCTGSSRQNSNFGICVIFLRAPFSLCRRLCFCLTGPDPFRARCTLRGARGAMRAWTLGPRRRGTLR